MSKRVAVFRPADERMESAVSLLKSLGVEPVADPMLAIEPTGEAPRRDATHVVFTSKTAADLLADDWEPEDATVWVIGPGTAEALEGVGVGVDELPETYSSDGLVDALGDGVSGAKVEVARSDHGSDVLLDGLGKAGAYVHETVLYRLVRPDDGGESATLAANGELDAALFTSSLTVEHFLEAAADRGAKDETVAGLDAALVGAIGEPTATTAREHGITVDVIPEEATFEALARAVVDELASGSA